jgi:hypothetical protein
LAEHRPSVLSILELFHNDHENKQTRPCERELQELLQKLLLQFKKTFIIIDALDEFPDDSRGDLLTILSSLQASLLLTSRPLRLLEHILPDAVYIHIDAENRKDIELFIDKKVQETPRLSVLLRGKELLRKEICAKLKEKSEGMYVF